MLSATSRKYLRGPRGMGFLYVERNLCQQLEPTFLDLHSARLQTPDQFEVRGDARRFENWEYNTAAKLGWALRSRTRWHSASITSGRIQLIADRLRADWRRSRASRWG